jgi:hypothetical protein
MLAIVNLKVRIWFTSGNDHFGCAIRLGALTIGQRNIFGNSLFTRSSSYSKI